MRTITIKFQNDLFKTLGQRDKFSSNLSGIFNNILLFDSYLTDYLYQLDDNNNYTIKFFENHPYLVELSYKGAGESELLYHLAKIMTNIYCCEITEDIKY